jgi:predicted membrane protein
MKAIKLLGVSLAAVALSASAAFAKVEAGAAAVTPLPKAVTLADSVVVTPAQPVQPIQNSQPVQPMQAVPVTPVPQRTVVTESRPRNYMATIAVSALMGGVAGLLLGGAIYYLDDQENARNIAYWAAGGVLVGTGIGVINVVADESRAERAVGMHHPRDPAPTYRLSLLRATF